MNRTAVIAVAAVVLAPLAACSEQPGGVQGTGKPDVAQAMAGPLITASPARPGPAPPAAAPRNAGSASPSPTGNGTSGGTAKPVVVLDPGHNGANAMHPEIMRRQVPAGFGQYKDCNTVGAETRSGYTEHEFTFDMAQRVRTLLVARGVEVRMTRPNDSGVGPCVNERAAYGNDRHADAVVSIHADSSPVGHGFHVIEAGRPPAGARVAAASHRLAVAVHERYLAESAFALSTYLGRDGYDRRTDLAGLNLSTRPTIFIECGNMLDAGDAARMESAQGRQRAAQALADGILDYLGHR